VHLYPHQNFGAAPLSRNQCTYLAPVKRGTLFIAHIRGVSRIAIKRRHAEAFHDSRKAVKMDYRRLGNSGAVVSTLCLGTMTFGAEADEATAHKILDDYVAAGGTFIDTADVYSAGASEEIIGNCSPHFDGGSVACAADDCDKRLRD
jgi:hypothetical protein